ncbi:hypothetical protein [Dankookia sp. P2]|uniref:hypothetical protein n=1 Tax=Dankookia sp. P2 TaxID=3423955 RepID=UPI003D677D3A
MQAIAAASGRPPETVADFLDRHDLKAQGLIPRPVDLTVRRVAFGGEKRIDGQAIPFEFDWPELSGGLWLVGSGRNSRGKTSLLGIMRWLLRGTPPDSIPPDVMKWIRHAAVDFDLDGVRHRVSLDLCDGFRATLTEGRLGARSIFEAGDEGQFASAMSDFMLRALALEPVTSLRRDANPAKDGRTVHHRWPALFGAFHIGTDYSALIGDVTLDGLTNRMLNMFAGFPHATAVARIHYVMAGLDMAAEQETQTLRAVADHAKARAERLRSELAALGAAPADGGTAAGLLASVRSTSDELAGLYARLPELRRALADAQEVVAAARAGWNADRLALQNFVEDRAAERVFRSLNPKCCPRCDRAFGADRKDREAVEHACMVCGEVAPEEDEAGVAEARARLEENERLSARAHASARDADAAARAELRALEYQVTSLESRLAAERARQAAASAGEADLTRRAVLEAMIAEAEADAGGGAGRPESDEAAIAKACDKVFRQRLKAEQEEVLEEVRTEVLGLLRELGVVNLVGVDLNTVPHLHLLKGEERVAFGAASIGDKMRVKVALILALMKVARRRGVGSHPGLLFIDTPGAQEMASEDLAALADGLASLCRELPTLQIFVATQRVSEFGTAVNPACRLVASGDDMLW